MLVVWDAEAVESQEELVGSPSIRCEYLLAWLESVPLLRRNGEVDLGVVVCPPGLVLLLVFLFLLGDFLFFLLDYRLLDV